MSVNEDFWREEDFENTVSSALIACFETKTKKNRGAAPADRLNKDRIAVIRKEGPYIASNSRFIEARNNGNWYFDLAVDPLPVKGLYAFRPDGLVAKDNPNAYLCAQYIRQVDSLGRYWHKRSSGTLYEMLVLVAESNAIAGERRFFTVTKDGEVVSCSQKIPNNPKYQFGSRITFLEHDVKWLHETSVWASVTLQALADKRHCWTITAQEQSARAHLGCMQEEVKSLLYARSLPMTSTGRKRPILHLVEAHKRRMRNGTDVDVTAFLRGQQTVEIGGTVFAVIPPRTLQPRVSLNSQVKYFDAEEPIKQ